MDDLDVATDVATAPALLRSLVAIGRFSRRRAVGERHTAPPV